MAIYLNDVSRTFGEYLLIPGLTTKECIPANVYSYGFVINVDLKRRKI